MQEEQAEGYARFALFHYAHFEWELRRYISQYGGLWMLSSTVAEVEVGDAVYRIRWHVNPFNERDQSFLRTVVDQTPNQELHGFLERLAGTEIGIETHREWQEWVAACSCTWDAGAAGEAEHFPTHRHHEGIDERCGVHQVVAACADYCDLVDREWLRIADWYHLDEKLGRGVDPEALYRDWRASIPARSS